MQKRRTIVTKSIFLLGSIGLALALAALLTTRPEAEQQSAKRYADGGSLVAFAQASGGQPPRADAGFDQTVVAGATVVLDASGSSDPEGDELSFAWTLESMPPGSLALISDPAAVKPSFQADLAGDYVARLTATGDFGNSASDTVIVSTGNVAPMADAGPDQTVSVNDTVRLDASASSDVNGDALDFTWSLTGKPLGSLAALDDAQALRPSFTADLAGEYMLGLSAGDGALTSAADTVRISTYDSHPVAEAGPDQKVAVGQTVLVRLEGLFDVDGELIEERDWSIIVRPPGSSADFLAGKNRRFIIDAPGTYVVQRMTIEEVGGDDDDDDGDAFNGGAFSGFDTVILITDANIRPLADAGPDQSVLPGDSVALRGAGSSDLDGDRLTYRWALTTRPAGSSAVLDDPAAVNPGFEADLAGSYVAQLIVKDGAEESRPDTLVITTTGNSRPVANAGPDQQQPKKNTITLDASGSSDADGDALSYDWSLVKRPSASGATLNNPTAVGPTFFTDTGRRFVAQLIVRDGELASAPDNVVVGPGNMRPVAEAGPDQEVLPGQLVNLDGTGSFDAAGDPLVFQWALIAVPEGSSAALAGATTATPNFTADLPGVYVAQLVITDDDVAPLVSDPDTVVIAINNTPPLADAGPDQVVPTRTAVTLDGTGSSDANGDPLSFAWSFASKPVGSTAELAGAGTAAPGFVADLAGDYVVQLIVNDGIVDSDPDLVTVTADANRPLAEAGPDQSVIEGAAVTLDGSASADPDGRPLTYSWRFLFTPQGSAATFSGATAVGPSFTADLTGLYIAELTVSDGAFDSQPDTVAVRAGSAVANSAPTLDPIGNLSVALGSTLRVALTGSDPGGDAIFFRAAPVPLPEGASLDAASGLFTFTPGPEQVGDIAFTFTVSDGLAAVSESVLITVTGATPGGVTAFAGRVLDADAFEAGSELPVVGATVSILGVSALTDATGAFTLSGAPGGSGVVVLDPSTAGPAPDGSAYAGLNETVELIADVFNLRDEPFFLMRVDPASLVTVSTTGPTVVENPALPGVRLDVALGSTMATALSVSALPRELAPASLPPSVLPCQIVKVLPFGATFNPAASLTLPNLDNLPAGTTVDLWGLDPATGGFRVLGQGSVDSATAITATSLITEATYLFAVPRAPGATAAADENAFNQTPTALADGNLSTSYSLPTYRSLGVDRGATFVYNSTAADPRPIIAAEVTFPAATGLPALIEGRLEVGGIEVAGPVFMRTDVSDPRNGPGDPPLVAGDTIRQAISFGAGQFPTGSYPYRYTATGDFGCSNVNATSTGSILIDNRAQSAFGAGWSLAGLSSLTVQPNGSVVLRDGDGTTKVFEDDTAAGAFLFEDGFNSENNGVGQLLFANFTKWDLVGPPNSSVDLIGNGFFDLQPGNGLYIDGDGSLDLGGTMQTKEEFLLAGGDYRLVFRLAGNLRQAGADSVTVSLGTLFEETITLASTVPFTLFVRDIPVAGLTAARIRFQFLDADRGFRGLLLDDVTLQRSGPGALLAGPAGDFTALVRNDDGSFTRILKNGTVEQYDPAGLLLARNDRNGNETRFFYDAQGRIAKIADPISARPGEPDCVTPGVTCFDYGAGTRLETVQGPTGRLTAFEPDAIGRLQRAVNPDGSLKRFVYDANKRLIQEVSERGFVTTHNYGAAGKWAGSGFPDGASITANINKSLGLADLGIGLGSESNPLPYARPNGTAALQDAKGNPYTMKFNAFGSSVEIIDPVGRTTTLTRNADDLVIQVVRPSDGELPDGTKPGQVVTQIDYDARGNVTAQREAVGTTLERTNRFVYEPVFNNVTLIADPSNSAANPQCGTAGVTCFAYDAQGNLEQIAAFVDGQTIFPQTSTYDSRGLELTRQDAENNITEFVYTPLGDLDKIIDAELNETKFARDGFGNVTQTVEGFGTPEERTTSATYDALNRVETETDGEGAVIITRYDAAGNRIESEDPTGVVVSRRFDPLNRLVEENDPAQGPVMRGHDANGNLETVTNSLDGSYTLVYDAVNRLEKAIDPLGNERLFSFDRRDNPATVTDARRNTTSFTFDVLGRQIRRTNARAETWRFEYDSRNKLIRTVDAKGQTIDQAYDALSRLTTVTLIETDGATVEDTVTFTYDANGNRLTAKEGDSSLAFTYDDLNRVVTVQTLVDAGTIQASTVLTSSYDALGSRTQLTHGSNELVVEGTWTYSHDAAGRLTGLVSPVGDPLKPIALAYDAAGRLSRIDYPNQVVSEFLYDLNGRAERITHRRDLTELTSFAYGYDAEGKITSISEPTDARNFTYDELQQLTSGGFDSAPESYEYDEEGNRIVSHLSGMHSYDDANRLLADSAFTYTYDANGNLVTKTEIATGAVTTFVWDVQNRLVRIDFPDATSAGYRYDAQGQRIEKDVNGTVTRYVYDGDAILLEYDGSGALKARYSHGLEIDQPLAMERGGQDYAYHVDHLGSIRKLTNAAGAVANTYDTDAFGRFETRLEAVANPYAFTAREFDPESGLLFYRARYYSASTGRFVSEDPIGFSGSDINFYGYTLNNPTNSIDPTGQISALRTAAISALNAVRLIGQAAFRRVVVTVGRRVVVTVGRRVFDPIGRVIPISRADWIISISGGATSGIIQGVKTEGTIGEKVCTGALVAGGTGLIGVGTAVAGLFQKALSGLTLASVGVGATFGSEFAGDLARGACSGLFGPAPNPTPVFNDIGDPNAPPGSDIPPPFFPNPVT